MKPIQCSLPLLLLLAVLAACGPKRYPQVLLAADSLTLTSPDSAVTLLRSLCTDMEREDKPVRMYYALLCIKAHDKAYLPHTSDSAVQAVLHYYEDRHDRRHLPEAYYYAGRVASDLGDAPQALEYFEKSLEAMPAHGMLSLRSKVLSQMGKLFSRQRLYPEALEKYRESLACDSLLADTMGMIFDLRDIGDACGQLSRSDDVALRYYKQAYQLSVTTRRTSLLADLQNRLSEIYLNKQQYDSAHVYLQKALQNSSHKDLNSIYLTAGIYYHTVNQPDSAEWYYQRLLQTGFVYSKRLAAGNLSQIALAKGDPETAIQYLRKHFKYFSDIQKITDTEGIRQMNALYNYQLREKENARLKMISDRKTRHLIYLGIAVGMLLTASLLHYRNRKKSWEKRLTFVEQQKEAIYRRSEQFLQANEAKIQQLSAQLQEQVFHFQESETARQQLENQIKLLTNTNQQIKLKQDNRKLAEDILFHSDIYLRFRQQLNAKPDGKLRLQSKDWEALQTQVDECYDNFSQKLNGPYQLDMREMHICLLIKLRFSYKDIGRLVNLSPSGVSSVRSRLYHKVFGQKGDAKEWDKFILSL